MDLHFYTFPSSPHMLGIGLSKVGCRALARRSEKATSEVGWQCLVWEEKEKDTLLGLNCHTPTRCIWRVTVN